MVTLEQKKVLAQRFNENFSQHKSMVLIETTNIDNNLMNEIKTTLTKQFGGKFLHGKKRSMAKSFNESENSMMQKLGQKIRGNIILYFHDSSCCEVIEVAEKFVKSGSAKYNQAALVDYTIQPQHTKLPPDTTKFFQKLRVPTKLTKGTIEITNTFQILEKGKPVTQMQIDVLSILKILPYTYQPVVTSVYTGGEIVDPDIYRTPADLISQMFTSTIGSAIGLGFGASFPAKPVSSAATSNVLSEAFALALELSGKVAPPEQFKEKIALLNDPEAMAKLQATAASSAPAATDATKAEAAPVQKEAESDSESAEEFVDF